MDSDARDDECRWAEMAATAQEVLAARGVPQALLDDLLAGQNAVSGVIPQQRESR